MNIKKFENFQKSSVPDDLNDDEYDFLCNVDNSDPVNMEGLNDEDWDLGNSLVKKGYLKIISGGHLDFLKKTKKGSSHN